MAHQQQVSHKYMWYQWCSESTAISRMQRCTKASITKTVLWDGENSWFTVMSHETYLEIIQGSNFRLWILCTERHCGIVEESSLCCSALIKKHCYWPKFVRGNAIKNYFSNIDVGSVYYEGRVRQCKSRVTLPERDKQYNDFDVIAWESWKMWQRKIQRLHSRQCYSWELNQMKSNILNKLRTIFSYRDAVDSHNSSRMFPVAMDETWKTTRWALRVFCFLMAETEVSSWLVLTNICKQWETSQQDFRKKLSRGFLHNKYLCQLKPPKLRKS